MTRFASNGLCNVAEIFVFLSAGLLPWVFSPFLFGFMSILPHLCVVLLAILIYDREKLLDEREGERERERERESASIIFQQPYSNPEEHIKLGNLEIMENTSFFFTFAHPGNTFRHLFRGCYSPLPSTNHYNDNPLNIPFIGNSWVKKIQNPWVTSWISEYIYHKLLQKLQM